MNAKPWLVEQTTDDGGGSSGDDSTTAAVEVGALAPDFALMNAEGDLWRLSEHRGRVVALLFYPGDETLVCTKQLCAVRDKWKGYLAKGAEVVGISPGSPTIHKDFAAHHNLPLQLLTDEDRSITRLYATHKVFPVWSTRALVVVDAQGIVRYRHVILRAFRPSNHVIFTAIHLAQYDALRRGHKTEKI